MQTLKYSRQREAIKQFLMSRKDHPSADTVYLNIKDAFPNISLGTVYRNLSLLSELGEIQKIAAGGSGGDRFDGNPAPHYHFICTECNSVLDLDMPNHDYSKELKDSGFKGEVTGYSTYFYGRCEHCKN